MFEHFRGRLPNLSIRGLTARATERRTDEPLSRPLSPSSLARKDLLPNVNLYAGCDLMEYFHARWRTIHETSQTNQQLAQQVTVEIERVEKLTSVMCKSMNKLIRELSTLEDVQRQLEEIETEVILSDKLLEKLDEAISELQREEARQEVNRQKEEAKQRLEKTIKKKSMELDDYRRQLIANQEEKEKQMLKEREAVFQQAFEEELKLYKEKGKLPLLKTELLDDPKDLGNVTLEFDDKEKQDLENFLGDL